MPRLFGVSHDSWEDAPHTIAEDSQLLVSHEVALFMPQPVAGIELNCEPLESPVREGHESDEVWSPPLADADPCLRQEHRERAVLGISEIRLQELPLRVGPAQRGDAGPKGTSWRAVAPTTDHVAL